MPKTSQELIEEFLTETKGESWQKFPLVFVTALQNTLVKLLTTNHFDTTQASHVQEAQAAAALCFFNGHIKRVFMDENFSDELMKELMIESSHLLNGWLMMRDLLAEDKRYYILVNYLISQEAFSFKIFQMTDFSSKDRAPESYLQTLGIHLKLMQSLVRGSAEDFQVALASILYVGDRLLGEQAFEQPSSQREANAITAFVFRNTGLEDLHAGEKPANQEILRELKRESILKLANWLYTRDKINHSPIYNMLLNSLWVTYCENWQE